MGLGIFAVWDFLRRGLGLVYVSGHAAAGRAFPVGAGAGGVGPGVGLAGIWRVGRCCGVDRAGGAFDRPAARFVDLRAALAEEAELDAADVGGSTRGIGGDGALARTELRDVPPVHSDTQRIWVGAVHWKQRRHAALGGPQPASESQRRGAGGIYAARRTCVYAAQNAAGEAVHPQLSGRVRLSSGAADNIHLDGVLEF